MASGKRASMREGPLAALFRRTDEDVPEQGADPTPAASAPEGAQPVVAQPQAEAPVPAQEPVVAPDAAAVPPATPAAARRREPDPLRDSGPSPTPPHPRETGYPHPSLGA